MQDIHFFPVLMRWLHVTGAIVVGGGSIFALVVVLPVVRGLEKEVRSELNESMRKRFNMLFTIGITALIVSGFYNYIAIEVPRHHGQVLYHGIIMAKIVLAFVVFFVGSALVGRSAAFEGMRRKRRRWMRRNVVLLLIIVALAAILRAIPPAVGGG